MSSMGVHVSAAASAASVDQRGRERPAFQHRLGLLGAEHDGRDGGKRDPRPGARAVRHRERHRHAGDGDGIALAPRELVEGVCRVLRQSGPGNPGNQLVRPPRVLLVAEVVVVQRQRARAGYAGQRPARRRARAGAAPGPPPASRSRCCRRPCPCCAPSTRRRGARPRSARAPRLAISGERSRSLTVVRPPMEMRSGPNSMPSSSPTSPRPTIRSGRSRFARMSTIRFVPPAMGSTVSPPPFASAASAPSRSVGMSSSKRCVHR